MIRLDNLVNLQSIDFGFNRLEDFKKTLGELLKVKNTLTSFSVRHQRAPLSKIMVKMAGEIPFELTSLTKLYDGGSQIDYNRLTSYDVKDTDLLNFLNKKFVNTSNAEDDLNTTRLDQYQNITV